MTFEYTSPLTREQFLFIRTQIKNSAATKSLAPYEVVLNNLIRGLPLDRGFSPITNPIKLSNGYTAMDSFNTAKRMCSKMLKHYTMLSPADVTMLQAKL